MTYTKPVNLSDARTNRRYHGKILISSGGEVHGTYSEEKAAQLYRQLQRKYPHETPITTVIAKGPLVLLPVSWQ